MCGIFCVLNGDKSNEQFYKQQFIKGYNRGPEDSKFVSFVIISSTSNDSEFDSCLAIIRKEPP